MTPPRHPAPRFLIRELLPVVLVALGVFFSIRRLVLEQYLVPSASMAPSLVGDPQYGDRVLVSKLARLWWQPQRFDMVVLRNPDDPSAYLVKRLVALPGETVSIRRGDVWLEQPSGRLQRVEKDPMTDRDLRVPWVRLPDADHPRPLAALGQMLRGGDAVVVAGPGEEPAIRLLPGASDAEGLLAALAPEARRPRLEALDPDGTLPGYLSTMREVDTSFPLPGGQRGGDEQDLATDPVMAVRLVPEDGLQALVMVWEHRGAVHRWVHMADGTLRYGGPKGSRKTWHGRPLKPGRAIDLAFGHLDGRRFLVVDGVLVDLAPVDLPTSAYAYEYPRPRPPRNGLHIGCAGEGGAGLVSLEVGRDLQYRSPDIPRHNRQRVRVPADEFFLLGDNATASRDSSSMDPPHFRTSDLVGRPVMVLAPSSRRRTLTR